MAAQRVNRDFLLGRFDRYNGALRYRYETITVIVEPWGANSLRVRATKKPAMPDRDWALLKQEDIEGAIVIDRYQASITNGKITAIINQIGKLWFENEKGEILLEEFVRNLEDMYESTCSALLIEAREFKPIIGGDYQLTARFVANPSEKIFGMGQYQHGLLNLKGTELELAQRNSQASVPFALSSLGYGMLWNNPAIGRVSFATNCTSWTALSTDILDYWITAGDTPAEIEEAYANATGKVPMMPDFGTGFWQCKLRYQTQEELLSVAREHKRRGLPISVIVIDFFHWPMQGDWKFDPVYWPDPDAMIRELNDMGIELMVSIWPNVDHRSENYEEMRSRGLLMRTESGSQIAMNFMGNTIHFDATNPEAREFVWDKVKNNYYKKGIRTFWLDVAEPQYDVYDFDHFRFQLGTNLQVGNIYPALYAKTFFDGMSAEGEDKVVNLIRCAWAGSQRYGALAWSGDIHSSFESLGNQVVAGLNMGLSGIPWWTSDIGGFFAGDVRDARFHELLIRWFQYGTFCPVMRLHGRRWPDQPQQGTIGGAECVSGADNEVWSYGDAAYEIFRKYLNIREKLRPYITGLMEEAHEKGTPVMRTMFYEFPDDRQAWEDKPQYMFGPELLIAPITAEGQHSINVYLPAGAEWMDAWTGTTHAGGMTITVEAALDKIPVFLKQGAKIDLGIFAGGEHF